MIAFSFIFLCNKLNGTSVYCITELKRSKTIYRITDRNKFGRVALVGPLTNLVMGFSFLISTYIYPYHSYLYAGTSLNAWIAMFNSLPFGVLDGEKIFDWSKINGFYQLPSEPLFISLFWYTCTHLELSELNP